LVLELRFESKTFLFETSVLTSRLEYCMLLCAICVIVFTCVVLYCTVLYCTVLCCLVHCSTLPPGIDPFAINNNNDDDDDDNNNNISGIYKISRNVLRLETEKCERVPTLHFWRRNDRIFITPNFSAHCPLVLVKLPW
jgi:hypothetical protein